LSITGHDPFRGIYVIRQRFSRMPENNCMPKIPKRTIMNNRNTTTFPRSGKDTIND